MSQVPNIPNINEYHEHFNRMAPLVKNQPRTDRTCNDKCCYGVFILFTLILIGGGIFFLISADFNKFATTYGGDTSVTEPSTNNKYDIENLKPGIPVIFGMILLSVILAIVFLCLLVRFPKCMFYFMLAVGGLLIVGLAILMFATGQPIGGAVITVMAIAYGAVVFCNKDKIRIGVVLLQTASRFVMQKPTVMFAPFIMMIFIIAFQVFWLASLVAITLYGDVATESSTTANSQNQQLSTKQTVSGIFAIIWLFLQLFYSFFFYYCMVFLIATAAAMWYYNVDGNYLCTGVKRIIVNHLGSFTLAATIVALVSMARQAADRQSRQNAGAAAICLCILACFLHLIQDLLQTLNHNAIIVMAVTGESYLDSAKSTLSLIYDNFMLFFLIDMISMLLKLTGVVFICAIPGIVGYLLLQATAENPDDKNFMTIGTVIIVLVAMLIGGIFLSVLSQALSCVFIFFCLDRKFMQMGYPTPNNVPPPMRRLFEQINNSTGQNYSHPAGYPSNQAGPAYPYNSQGANSNYNRNTRGSGYPSLN